METQRTWGLETRCCSSFGVNPAEVYRKRMGHLKRQRGLEGLQRTRGGGREEGLRSDVRGERFGFSSQ